MLELLDRYRHKIKSAEELRDIIGPRPRKKREIMCHGVFDVVHPGHVRHLLYGRSKADPTLQYSPDYPGGSNVTLISVSGMSPFAEWISINLDGKPLSKAQWVPNPEFGFYQDPPPLDPAPGTWIRRDPLDPTDLPFSSDVGYLNTDTGQFLSSYFRISSKKILSLGKAPGQPPSM